MTIMHGAPIGSSDLVRYSEIIPPFGNEPFATPPDPRRSLNDLLQTVWRWRGRFALVFLGILCLGALALFVMPIKYTAQALVMIGTREPNALVTNIPSGQPWELDVDGAIQVMTSALSIHHIIEKLDLSHQPEFDMSAQDAKPDILVRLRSLVGSTLEPYLEATARAHPDLAESLLAVSHATLWTHIGLEHKVDPVTMIGETIDGHLKVDRLGRSSFVTIKYTAGNPQLASDIANAIANNTAADDAFQSNLTMTERAGFDLLRVWLVSPATVPVTPSSPNVLGVLAIALGGGLCAALSAVLFSDYYATRKLISAGQIARHGVRALGFIPAFSGREKRAAVRIVSERPREAFSDSIASLRASLLRLVPHEPPTCLVLLFTSALPFEGKSTMAAALATSIATSGGRVLLIDADLRSPTLHRVFGTSSLDGLSNLQDRNEPSLDQFVQVDAHSGVHLLTAGPRNAHPVDILTSKQLANAIDAWRNSFDYILIDAPPVLATPDAVAMVPIVDYCVLVVRWGKTAWETIRNALRMLADADAKIAGIAVSRIDRKRFAANGFPSGRYGQY